MLKREWGAESNGKLLHLFIPSKVATLVPVFAVEELSLGQICNLGSCVCSEIPALGQNALIMMMMMFFKNLFNLKKRYDQNNSFIVKSLLKIITCAETSTEIF